MKEVFLFLLSVGATTLAFAADISTVAVKSGEEWQFDWSWREKNVPLTAAVRPCLKAYDAAGKVVYENTVGRAQQRVFDPNDLNIQKWRVYAHVAEAGSAKNGGTFTTLARYQLPATTERVELSLLRLGDPAEIGDVTFASKKLDAPDKEVWRGFPKMSDTGRVLTDEELDAHLAQRVKCVPKLISRGDRTELEINGKVVVPRVFKSAARACANRFPSISVYSKKGFNVLTMGFNLRLSPQPNAASSTGLWKADDTADVEKVRKEIREYLRRAPDSMFMLVIGIAPRVGWGAENPTEIVRNEKGEFGIFQNCRLCAYDAEMKFDAKDPRGQYPMFSYTSVKFANDCAKILEQLFAGLEDTPEGKAVIGAYVCGGTDGQWLDIFDNHVGGRQAADYADCAKSRFAAYRKRKYGDETVSTEIPKASEFWDRSRKIHAEHASTPMSDYYEFLARSTTQLRLTLAKAVKRGSRGRVLVGSYSPNGGLEGYPLISETFAKGLLTSPDYDFFAIVPAYVREHVDPVNSAVADGSMIRRGKLYISELDLRTADVFNWGFWGSSFWMENHSDATFRRKALFFSANAITHGGTFHAYDMDGGWYATEASQATWSKANEMADFAHAMPLAAERIALVGGERYWDFQSMASGRVVPYLLRELPKDALSFCGAPWNYHLQEELLAAEDANLPKVVIFNEPTTMTFEQYQTLRQRYAKDGRVIVWVYRPGLFAADGAKIEADLGLKIAPPSVTGKLPFADGACRDPLMKNVKGLVVPAYPYYGFEYPDRMLTTDGHGWKTLANFKGTDVPALAVRRGRDCTEVFASYPSGFTAEFCRNLLREAGLKPLVETNELAGYGSGLFYIVAQSDGEKRFRLPDGVLPKKTLEGPEAVRDGEGYKVTLKRGQIYILAVR